MNKIETYNDFFLQVKEGLIKTYPIKTAVKLISRELSLQKIKFNIDTEKSTNTLFIKLKSIDIVKDKLINIFRQVNLCGYFISNYDFYDKKDNSIDYLIHEQEITNRFLDVLLDKIKKSYYTQITIESKFNSIASVPNKLFHVTSSSNEKEKKDGFDTKK